jgi:hypothetical protein
MKKKSSDLSPRDRIEAALKLHQMESPGRPISIAGICAQASVSRANLYERHPDLVQRIRGPVKPAERPSTVTVTIADLRKDLANEKKKTKALHYFCVELLAEIHRLRARAAIDLTLPAGKPRVRRKT